jgi:hypothetical protein
LSAQVFDQVNVEEHPALTEFRAGDEACLGALGKRGRVQLQELRGFLQGERVHNSNRWNAGVTAKPRTLLSSRSIRCVGGIRN